MTPSPCQSTTSSVPAFLANPSPRVVRNEVWRRPAELCTGTSSGSSRREDLRWCSSRTCAISRAPATAMSGRSSSKRSEQRDIEFQTRQPSSHRTSFQGTSEDVPKFANGCLSLPAAFQRGVVSSSRQSRRSRTDPWADGTLRSGISRTIFRWTRTMRCKAVTSRTLSDFGSTPGTTSCNSCGRNATGATPWLPVVGRRVG